jgi:hypothetical protein
MKKLLALMLLLVGSSGCIFDDGEGHRHHGREYVHERDHIHCVGCGHVQVGGVWYIQD